MSTEICSLGSTVKEGIYGYEEKIERCRRIIAGFGANGEIALRLLNRLASLGLSAARVSRFAGHMPALLRVTDFNLKDAARADVERAAAWINRNPRYRKWIKRDEKIILRELIQYAKYGSCDGGTPAPPEASWIKLTVKGRDARATPEALLAPEDFEATVKAAGNPGDRAMLHVLFEAALRPGELLGTSVGSVGFKKDYCIIKLEAAYKAEEAAKALVEMAEEVDALKMALKERDEAIMDLRREIGGLKSLAMRMLNGGGQR